MSQKYITTSIYCGSTVSKEVNNLTYVHTYVYTYVRTYNIHVSKNLMVHMSNLHIRLNTVSSLQNGLYRHPSYWEFSVLVFYIHRIIIKMLG